MDGNHQRLITLKELLEKPQEDIEFLIEGMLLKAGLGLLAGKPKAGKSTLARVMALAVATGQPFLGFPTRKGAVLYYGLEEIESEVRRHFEELGVDGTENITVSTQPLPGKEIDTLKGDILRVKPVLVIIDPIFRAVAIKDANSYSEVSNALAPLLQLARSTNAHILCVHHLNKGGQTGADGILGSTAIRGAFDVNLLLNKTENHRTIQSENRYGEAIEETILVFDAEKRTVSLAGDRQATDESRMTEDILSFMSGASLPCSREEIELKVVGKTRWKRYALTKLVESGKIIRTASGRRGDPFAYSIACSYVAGPAPDIGNKQPDQGTFDDLFASSSNSDFEMDTSVAECCDVIAKDQSLN